MDTKCTKCGGYVIKEKYRTKEGECGYLRCVHCGKVWFENTLVKAPSFTEIGREMGVSKQMAHKIYCRAMWKMGYFHPEFAGKLK